MLYPIFENVIWSRFIYHVITHKKLPSMQCYHIYSETRGVYLSKNHHDSYSLKWYRWFKFVVLAHGLLRFSRYWHFFIFCENPRWPPKVVEIEIFPHLTGDSCTTLWVKNLLEIALSLMTFEIFVIFHIFTRSSNKVAITHLYIEQQL